MDYAGEQAMEIEALQAILMDDFREYTGTTPDNWNDGGPVYCIQLTGVEEGAEVTQENDLRIEFIFSHTPNYPDQPAYFKLRSARGLSDNDIAEATVLVQEQVEANLGMSMIYTLVSVAKEWLINKASSSEVVDPEVERKRLEDAAEARRAAARAFGTPVTTETFQAWSEKFELEMKLEKARLEEQKKDDSKGRCTGKAYFMREAASEKGTEEGPYSDEDEEDFEIDEDEEEDLDYDDDDDDGMLDEYAVDED